MRKSRLSWHKQERLIELFVSGSTARCTASLVDVNKTTAAYYFHRLHELIAHQIEQEAHEAFGDEYTHMLSISARYSFAEGVVVLITLSKSESILCD